MRSPLAISHYSISNNVSYKLSLFNAARMRTWRRKIAGQLLIEYAFGPESLFCHGNCDPVCGNLVTFFKSEFLNCYLVDSS